MISNKAICFKTFSPRTYQATRQLNFNGRDLNRFEHTNNKPQEPGRQDLNKHSQEANRQSDVEVNRFDRRAPIKRRTEEDWEPSPFFSSFFGPFERSNFLPSGFGRQFDRGLGRSLDNYFREITRDFQKDLDWSPRTDIHETNESFLITAEIPGVSKENIKIDIEDEILTLKGEKKAEQEVKDESGKVYKRERSYGAFQRRFVLPDNIDSKKVKANFEHGVLKLTVPKKVPSQEKKVEVTIQ